MRPTSIRKFKKYFIPQQGNSDCGIACLKSVLKFHESKNYSLEHLRVWSGTTQNGTSMAGIIQCAKRVGLTAEGFKASISALKKQTKPTILHVVMDDGRYHFMVCYAWNGRSQQFILSDPSVGVINLNEDQLGKVWVDRSLLQLTPNENFEESKTENNKWLILYDFLKSESNALIVGAFFGLIMALLGIMISVFIQRLIDSLLPNEMWGKIMETLVFLMILLLLRLVLGFLRGKLLAFFQESFSTGITSHFYSKLLNLPIKFFSHRKTGEIVSRLNDINRIQKGISSVLGNLSIDFVIVLVSILYLLLLSKLIALVVVISVVMYLISSMLFNKGLKIHNSGVMHSYAESENMFISTFSGIRDIQSNLKQQMFIEKGANLYKRYQGRVLSFTKFQLSISFWMGLIGLITQIICIYFGVQQVEGGLLTSGELIAIISITLSIQLPLTKLSLVNIQFSEIKVAFGRINELVSLTISKKSEKKFKEPIKYIEFRDVGLAYPGAPTLFDGLSLRIKANSITTIIGPSGSGKSSILNLLKKELELTQGQIIVNDSYDLSDIKLDDWLSKLGIVNQEVLLINGTLIENIVFAFDLPSHQKTEVIEFSQEMGFHQYFMSLPMKYLTVVEENGANLSGGQKQLIALARALYKKPDFLLLDEPTSSLDDDTEGFVISLLDKLKKSISIIAVSHRKEILKITDQIVTVSEE